MARVLDRLPSPQRRSRRCVGSDPLPPDRVGWGLSSIARDTGYGVEPNGNQAGADRAAVMAGDVVRYAAQFGISLTPAQSQSVLDRNGWLVYAAMGWIDRLVLAARCEDDDDHGCHVWPPEGREVK
jgi:hypothetical protein